VPTRKDGKKVFEEFWREASEKRYQKNIKNLDMRNIYNAAQQLSFDDWSWWVNDQYGPGTK
jgi:hypothetical protein